MGKSGDCKIPLSRGGSPWEFQWKGRDGGPVPPTFGAYLHTEQQKPLSVAGESFSAPHRDSTQEELPVHFVNAKICTHSFLAMLQI